MKLILNYNDYLAKCPVYGFELPAYLQKVLDMSLDDYYQAAMFQTQRIINAYMQDFLSQLDWDISNLDLTLQDQIKEILFLECDYLHQNQMFFKKSNDISYSTAGQQNFSYNTNMDISDDSLIPEYVKKMIKNTGILKWADSYLEVQQLTTLDANEFTDGVFVNEVAWSSKADNIMVYNGVNTPLPQVIQNLNTTKLSTNDPNYLQTLELANNFTNTTNSIVVNKVLSSNQSIPNKQTNDYAQMSDLNTLWNNSSALIQNNSKDIQNLQSQVQVLDDTKISNATLQSNLNLKANTNWSNVNVGTTNRIKNVQVNYDGSIIYETASGNINPHTWQADVTYSPDDAVIVEVDGYAVIYVAKQLGGNLDKFPPNYPDYWLPHKQEISLDGYLKTSDAENTYFKLVGGQLAGDIDMQQNKIINASNLLTNESINDNQVSQSTLWSSSKINDELENQTLLLNSEQPQVVNTTFSVESTPNFNSGLQINNSTNSANISSDTSGNLNIQLSNSDGQLLVNGQQIKTDLSDYYTKEEVNDLIQNGDGNIEIKYKTLYLKSSDNIVWDLPAGVKTKITLNFVDFQANSSQYSQFIESINNGWLVSFVGVVSNDDIGEQVLTTVSFSNNWVDMMFNNTNNLSTSMLSKAALTLNVRLWKISGAGGSGSGGADSYAKYSNVEINENGVKSNAFILEGTNNPVVYVGNNNNIGAFDMLSTGSLEVVNNMNAKQITVDNLNLDYIENNKSVVNYYTMSTYVQRALHDYDPNPGSGDYTAGTNIQIQNNMISTLQDVSFRSVDINGKNVEQALDSIPNDYYNKTEIDSQVTELTNQVAGVNDKLSRGAIIVFMGTWNATTQYQAYDYVWFGDPKKTYFSLKPSLGIEPTNTEYWEEAEVTQEIELDNYYTKQEVDASIDIVNRNLGAQISDIGLEIVQINKQLPTFANKTDFETLQSTVEDINTRLTTLENDWSINKTTDMLIAKVKVCDTSFTVQIVSAMGIDVSCSGSVNVRTHSGYMDVGDLKSNYNQSLVITNGITTWKCPQQTDYQQSYDYFLVGIKAVYNNKNYVGSVHIIQKAWGDYDYNSVYNYENIILLPV